MSGQLPDVVRAAVDGHGPAKLTRRPARSCVECRMRKVKCDRKEPCGACIRIKSEKCTYRPIRAGIRDGRLVSPSLKPTAESNPRTAEQDLSEPSLQLLGGSNGLDPASKHRSATNLSTYDRPTLNHDSTERSVPGLDSQAETGMSSLVAVLLKENEHLRATVTKITATESDTRPISDILTDIPGTFQKSKFFGQSHWMNALEPYEALGDANTTVNPVTDRVEVNKSTELYKTVNELKTMGRVLKTARMLLPTIPPEVLNSLPSKATCDVLVDGYLRTFEGAFRVLHVPSFRREYEDYWSGALPDKLSIHLKIVLVCALGVPFYTGSDQPRLRVTCAKWVQAAENWLAAPHAKSRLNMTGLQIQILVLLAKQVCNIEGDHVWIPAGALLRTAMYLGLHRDPSYFGKINTFHAEMRRRLWATVMELTVQSSLDMGMPPLISVNDYDTRPPSNINDEDLREQDDAPLSVKPANVCTNCSIQIAFTESLPTRLAIVRHLNSLRFDLPYTECIQLGQTLAQLCQSRTSFFIAALGDGAPITPFQIKLHDVLTRRFVLNLHRPYFAHATNPHYAFSRTTCVDTALALFAPATHPVPGHDDDWTLLTHRAVGFFKALILYALSTLYTDLQTQIHEHAHTLHTTAALVPTSPTPTPPRFVLPPQSAPLLAALRSAHALCLKRLQAGETNAKGVVFMACALARVDALLEGQDGDTAVLSAALGGVKRVREILAGVYAQEHGVRIDLGPGGEAGGSAAKRVGRGDGADDVAGWGRAMGSGVGEGGAEVGGGGGMDGGVQGGCVDSDAAFLADPEWFFDLDGWMGVGMGMGMDGVNFDFDGL